jgi:ABC-type dipeptide/oligopeptide/nickel transport system permease component
MEIIILIFKRLLTALPSLFGVLLISFILTRALPGDPAAYLAGPAATMEAIEEIRKELGLDKNMFQQFILYLKNIGRGDLGTSWATGRPVLQELLNRLPASLEMTLLGLLISLLIAIPLGVVSATHTGSWIDHLGRMITTAGVSLPYFVTGLILVFVFYYLLGWFPAPMGRIPLFVSSPHYVTGFFLIDSLLTGNYKLFLETLHHIFLPSLTLGIFALAPIARMTRASMLGVLSSDFIRTTRACAFPSWKVLYVYAFQNAFLPVITTLGMVFSFLLGANVLVEKVFSWPGVGSFALESLVISDYSGVQGFVLTMGTMYVFVNLFIDIIYGIFDPRIRVEA